MTLLIVNLCAFANRTTKLPQHVGAMSWHQAKFHDFHACFGFVQIKKTKFLNVFSRATMPRCLNFIPISGMGPRKLPEDTHVIFQPALVHWSMCLYLKFELCTQRWHVPSQNHVPSWEGTFHICVHNSNLKYKHMFPCTKVGWKITCVSSGKFLGSMQEMGMKFKILGVVAGLETLRNLVF